jgi:hypothetical protein
MVGSDQRIEQKTYKQRKTPREMEVFGLEHFLTNYK